MGLNDYNTALGMHTAVTSIATAAAEAVGRQGVGRKGRVISVNDQSMKATVWFIGDEQPTSGINVLETLVPATTAETYLSNTGGDIGTSTSGYGDTVWVSGIDGKQFITAILTGDTYQTGLNVNKFSVGYYNRNDASSAVRFKKTLDFMTLRARDAVHAGDYVVLGPFYWQAGGNIKVQINKTIAFFENGDLYGGSNYTHEDIRLTKMYEVSPGAQQDTTDAQLKDVGFGGQGKDAVWYRLVPKSVNPSGNMDYQLISPDTDFELEIGIVVNDRNQYGGLDSPTAGVDFYFRIKRLFWDSANPIPDPTQPIDVTQDQFYFDLMVESGVSGGFQPRENFNIHYDLQTSSPPASYNIYGNQMNIPDDVSLFRRYFGYGNGNADVSPELAAIRRGVMNSMGGRPWRVDVTNSVVKWYSPIRVYINDLTSCPPGYYQIPVMDGTSLYWGISQYDAAGSELQPPALPGTATVNSDGSIVVPSGYTLYWVPPLGQDSATYNLPGNQFFLMHALANVKIPPWAIPVVQHGSTDPAWKFCTGEQYAEWHNLTLASGITVQGGAVPAYRFEEGNRLKFKGMAAKTSGFANGTVISTMPSGLWPPNSIYAPAVAANYPSAAIFVSGSVGEIRSQGAGFTSSTTWISLEGLSYTLDGS